MLLNAPGAVTLVHWGADPAPVEVEEAEAEAVAEAELGIEAEVELAAELAAEGDTDKIEVGIAVTVTVIVARTVVSAQIPEYIIRFRWDLGWLRIEGVAARI